MLNWGLAKASRSQYNEKSDNERRSYLRAFAWVHNDVSLWRFRWVARKWIGSGWQQEFDRLGVEYEQKKSKIS